MQKRPQWWLWAIAGILSIGVLVLIFTRQGGDNRVQPAPAARAGTALDLLDAPATPAVSQGLSTGDTLGLAIRIGIVAALLGGCLWLLRRYAGTKARTTGTTGAITLADTIPLAAGRVIYVLDIGDRALLVGATPQQLNVLGEVTSPATLAQLRDTAAPVPWPLAQMTQRLGGALRNTTARGGHRTTAASAQAGQAGDLEADDELAIALDALDEADRPQAAGHGKVPAWYEAAQSTRRLRVMTDNLNARKESWDSQD